MSDYVVEQKHHTVFEKPNYTQTPNILFDELMKDMGEAELKVTLCIIRKIVGYHKVRDAVSLSQIQEMTGLSRQGASDGLEAAMKRGTIERAGTGKRGVIVYQLVHSVDQSTQETRTSQASRPELVKQVDTQKKVVKEKSKEIIAPKERDRLFDGVSLLCFGINAEDENQKAALEANSGRIGRVVAYLKKTGATPEKLWAFKKWYCNKYPENDMPNDLAKFTKHYNDFAAAPVSAYTPSRAAAIIYDEISETDSSAALALIQAKKKELSNDK